MRRTVLEHERGPFASDAEPRRVATWPGRPSACREGNVMTARPQPATLDEFSRWEAEQPDRHEFSDGVITAFARGSNAHAALCLTLASAPHVHLRGSRCRALDEYRALATLEEYVLVDSRRRWVATYVRTGDEWIASFR